MHVTLVTKTLYEMEIDNFRELCKDKEEMYELISTSIFPKLRKNGEGVKTSTEESRRDREIELVPRAKKTRKKSIGCAGDDCQIY